MEAEPETPRIRADQADLLDALAQTAFVIMAMLNKVGAQHDLSLTQIRVLGILRDRRPRMAALADYLGLDKSTMTGLIARAEKRGLVQRAPAADDGRAVEVFLSPAGLELTTRLSAEIADDLSSLTGSLPRAERDQLRILLQRMLGPTPEVR
ncbi:MarR family winged helix-turn-helix transcriptional regulator [Nocardia sp. NPDC056100]|uniref:MarR family winged helix-turn-helix transcriptional regulator n=1 Tax=Nocardia sp. NPDC056100 TaxID=3345712 RepID=UPI0035DD6146